MAAQLWSVVPAPALTGSVGSGGVTSFGPSGPMMLPDGMNVFTAVFSTKGTTVTASVSDVIVLGYLPEGSVVVDGNMTGKSGATATNVKIGLGVAGGLPTVAGQANDGVFLATTALAARARTQIGAVSGLPYKVPAIAAATYPKMIAVIATIVGTSMTVSLSFGVTLFYTTHGQSVGRGSIYD